MSKPELTEKQITVLSALVRKSPQHAWQLAETLGMTTMGVSSVAGSLMERKYVGVGASGYFPRVTSSGAPVQPIPDGDENECMVQQFIAQHGVTVVPRGVGVDPELGGYFKRHRRARKKRTNGSAD